ncbi:MAG: hypothetical protein PSU94_09080 [Lacunisphaera sp.]|nr:hypothetical protein [Lacunisphaera sp.]
MYQQSELTRLAGQKTALRRVIAVRRVQCAAAADRATQPLVWLDNAMALWRKIPPLAKLVTIPLAVALGRSFLPRLKTVGSLLRWGPVALGVIRSLRR